MKLQKLALTERQISFRLPVNEQLQANQTYPIILIGPNGTQQSTQLSVRLCPNTIVNISYPDSEKDQLLLLIDSKDLRQIKHYFAEFNDTIIEINQLTALNKTLLTVKHNGDKLQQRLIDLRQRFPGAIVDYNDHFKSAERVVLNPRLFATKQLSWPSVPCKKSNFETIAIGLIDGQIDTSHPALIKQDIVSEGFLSSNQQADLEHGTAVAAIFSASKSDWGLQGLLIDSRLYSATVLQKRDSTSLATSASVVKAINWLLTKKVRLFNMSLAAKRNNLLVQFAIEGALQRGAIIFAAAGNEGKEGQKVFPAALDNVIAVTAVDIMQRPYEQANQDDYIDFSAPGVDVWTAASGDKGKYRSGTSFATPYATAVAALYLGQNKALSRDIVYRAMQSTALDLGKKGHDAVFGWGLLQAPKAQCS